MACDSSSLHSEDMNVDSGTEEATCGEPRLADREGAPGAQAPLPHVKACPDGGSREAVCIVSGCNTPLTKKYHQRCRICAEHMQSAQLLVGEDICRFCQKCKRFHALAEFEGSKRSCEKVLQRHNAKQRLQRSLKASKIVAPRRSSKKNLTISEMSNPDTPSSHADTTGTGSVSAAPMSRTAASTMPIPEKVDPALVSLFAAQAQLVQQQQAQLAALQAQTAELRSAMPPPPPPPVRMTRRRSLEAQRALSLFAFPSARLPEISDRDIQLFLNNVEGSWQSNSTAMGRDGSGTSVTGTKGSGSLLAGPPMPAGGPLGALAPAPSLSLSIMERLTSGPLDSIVDQALLEYCMNEWGNGGGEGRAAAARLPPVLGFPEAT